MRAGLANAALLASSLALSLGAGELVVRLAFPRPAPAHPPAVARPCGACAPLYELDPSRPGVSAQATRDRVYQIPKPPGRYRILVLGDSIAYGARVPRRDAFPERLEALLAREGLPAEVVNAGVSGYSAWNEERWFAERGRAFQPDLVLVAACLNDVVDPLPHWARGVPVLREIPSDAIPDPEYHARKIEPLVRWRSAKVWLAEHSALGRGVAASLLPRLERWLPFAAGPPPRRAAGGRVWPVHLTLEDDLALDVLLSADSAQWRWLRRTYDALAAEVAAAGARVALVVFPLAYQMDPGYPFLPQSLYRSYCESRGLACLDLLPALRAAHAPAEALWLDDWHPSPRGHALAAEAILSFLDTQGWLPRGIRYHPRGGGGG